MPATQTGLPTLAVAHSDVLSWWRAVHREAAPAEWERTGARSSPGCAPPTGSWRLPPPCSTIWRDHYGSPRLRYLIPNGIDIAFYAPQPKRAAIMAGGRLWDEAKNLALLDTAAADSRLAGRDCRGGGPSRRGTGPSAGGACARRADPGRNGRTARGRRDLRGAGTVQPFGLGILEAAASGCALVLGDIPSLRENWDGAALFAPPNDAGAWRTTLSCLIACDSRREALGTAARRRALAFSRERMATRYAELYCELLSSRRGPGKVGNSGGFARTRLTFPRLWRGPLPLPPGSGEGQ